MEYMILLPTIIKILVNALIISGKNIAVVCYGKYNYIDTNTIINFKYHLVTEH